MSIQTRSKRRNNRDRGGRSTKMKHESLFFSGALKRLQKSKMKKSKQKEAIKADGNYNEDEPHASTSSSNHICPDEKHTKDEITVRSSLFEKFKLPKLNPQDNAAKFLTFEYSCDDEEETTHVDTVSNSSKSDLNLGKFDFDSKAPFKDLFGNDPTPATSEQSTRISVFASEILLDVKQKIDSMFPKDRNVCCESISAVQNRKSKKQKIFDKLPRLPVGHNFRGDLKDLASDYLYSFLSTVCDTDDTTDEPAEEKNTFTEDTKIQDEVGESRFCSTPAINNGVRYDTESCSFSDTLFDEGYLSKPVNVQSVCPWPTSGRCLLSSRIESKNGHIYVVKEQKCPKYENRDVLADIKKKKRTYMLGNPPKFITPMEYHSRMMEHREYLERRQWQNIVHSQDYESYYNDKPPTKIPEYIYHNQTRHALATNSQLLGYLASRASLFTDETWERIERMAEEARYPLNNLSPFHIDHFFYQFFFFSTAYLKGMKRSKKRKRSNLYQYFQPELYILPQHKLPRQQNSMFKYYPHGSLGNSSQSTGHASTTHQIPTESSLITPKTELTTDSKEAVPSLPEVPRASTHSPSKSPEMRTVENVYCYKRKNSNIT